MNRFLTPGGHIFHPDDPALTGPSPVQLRQLSSSLSRSHDMSLNLVKPRKAPQAVRIVGHHNRVGFAAAAAAAALIPQGGPRVTIPGQRPKPKPRPPSARSVHQARCCGSFSSSTALRTCGLP